MNDILPHSRNRQNIDINKPECCWSGEKLFIDMYCDLNLQTQIDKMQ